MKSINKMISEIELNIYGNCIITSNLNDRISSNISDECHHINHKTHEYDIAIIQQF